MQSKNYSKAAGVLLLTMAAFIGMGNETEAAAKQKKTAEYIYEVKKGEVTIVEYIGKKKKVTIPSKIKGKKVTKIGSWAFNGKKVTTLTVPNSVKKIENMAFHKMPKLKKITLSKNIKKIPFACFEGCSRLESIKIPKKVTSIGNSAFHFCTSLKSITIPKSVKKLDYFTFRYCTSLKKVSMNKNMSSIEGEVFADCGNLTSIGNITVDKVESRAFINCKKLKSTITLSDKCQTVGSSAFENCYKANIVMSETVTDIRDYAFKNCKKLTAITIPANFKRIGFSEMTDIEENPAYGEEEEFIKDYVGRNFNMNAFAGCCNVSKISVKDANGAIKEENGVLYNRDKTVVLYVLPTYKGNLDFLKNVKYIGYYAMSGFNQTSVVIPDNIEDVKDGAFFGAKCSNIYWNPNVALIRSQVFAESEITSLSIPEGVTNIIYDAISYCKKCKKVSLPASLKYYSPTDIEVEGVMMGMSALENIEVAEENKRYSSEKGLLFDGYELLRYPAAKKGKTYKVPQYVTLGTFAFDCLKYLKKIELHKEGDARSTYNFMSNCKNVTVKLPKCVDVFPSPEHTGDFPMFLDCKNCVALVYKNSKAHKFFKKQNKYGKNSCYLYKVIKK